MNDSNKATSSGVGAPEPTEIDITPAMIRASVETWKSWDADTDEPENMIAATWFAMIDAWKNPKRSIRL